jgi:DNA-binding transcriptional MerR regulator
VAAGLHPELVRRLVTLGLLEPETDRADQLWFGPAQLARAARIQRLRAGLGVNCAALGVVLDRRGCSTPGVVEASRVPAGASPLSTVVPRETAVRINVVLRVLTPG